MAPTTKALRCWSELHDSAAPCAPAQERNWLQEMAGNMPVKAQENRPAIGLAGTQSVHTIATPRQRKAHGKAKCIKLITEPA